MADDETAKTGRETRPLDETGNGSRIRTIAFDTADATMLMRAMSVAAATAMMSKGRESIGRLDHYQKQFAAFAPAAHKLLDRDTDLCEIGIIAAHETRWTLHRVREHSWSGRFRTVVTVGGRRFLSAGLVEDEQHGAIAEMIADVVPLDCERVDEADVEGNPWFA